MYLHGWLNDVDLLTFVWPFSIEYRRCMLTFGCLPEADATAI